MSTGGKVILVVASMVFGPIFVALAGYCFIDLFIRGMPDEWHKAGLDWYIPVNWALMIVAAIGAICMFVLAAYTIYLFVLSAKRSKSAATPPTGQS